MENPITQTESWAKTHERLIISVLVILAFLFLGNKLINYSAEKAHAELNAVEPALTATIQSNKDLAAAVAQQNQTTQQLLQTLIAQNQQLEGAIAKRETQVVQQQKADYSMPLPDLANRWKSLAGLSDMDIRKTDTGLELSEAGSRSTVSQLELVPVLQQNLSDERSVVDNKNQQIDSLTGLNKNLTTQVDGLQKQTAQQDQACKAQIDVVKADARKSKARWFGAGVAVGSILKAVVTGFIHG